MRDIISSGACAGKTVFVAGGSSGINLGIAERFAALGARIALISRNETRVCDAAQGIVAKGGVAIGISADVRDYDAVERAIARSADTEGMARLAPSAQATAALKARIPLREYGTKRDIADTAVFLASDNASDVTGAIIDCDGGSVLGDASADALSAMARSA